MTHIQAPSEQQIKDMQANGYIVTRRTDLENAGYIWSHPDSGATQLKTIQPPRRSAEQAWHDCAQYLDPDGTETTRPDWVKP